MLAGACAVQRRSYGWTFLACLAAFGAILAHTLQGMVFGGLFVAILVTAIIAADKSLAKLLSVVVVSGLASVAFFAWYLLPLVRGWNSGETWGYSLAHSLMASMSQLGWPIALLAALGLLCIWRAGSVSDRSNENQKEQAAYWTVWTVVWAAASLVLPFFVSYH